MHKATASLVSGQIRRLVHFESIWIIDWDSVFCLRSLGTFVLMSIKAAEIVFLQNLSPLWTVAYCKRKLIVQNKLLGTFTSPLQRHDVVGWLIDLSIYRINYHPTVNATMAANISSNSTASVLNGTESTSNNRTKSSNALSSNTTENSRFYNSTERPQRGKIYEFT